MIHVMCQMSNSTLSPNRMDNYSLHLYMHTISDAKCEYKSQYLYIDDNGALQAPVFLNIPMKPSRNDHVLCKQFLVIKLLIICIGFYAWISTKVNTFYVRWEVSSKPQANQNLLKITAASLMKDW